MAAVTGMAAGDPTRVAGRRIIGYILDSIFDLMALGIMVGLFGLRFQTGVVGGVVRPDVGEHEASKWAVVSVVYLVYWLATRVGTLGILGWTPGMLLMGLRCTNWHGRPCGVLRAFLRSTVFTVGAYLFGILFTGGTTVLVWYAKGHKGPHDFLAGTFVIDSMFRNRMILETSGGGVYSGPPVMTREEGERIARQAGIDFVPPPDPRAKSGEPVYDKALDTYVVFNHKQQAWLAFDKANGGWSRIG